MQVIVEAKNMTVTQALRTFIEEHARKLEKVAHKIGAVRVYLETVPKKSNDPFANEVTFTVEVPGKGITVKKHAADMYEAIVDAAHGAVRKVRKKMERRADRRRLRTAQGVALRDAVFSS